MIINDFKKINVNVNTSHIEQWSILSINYVEYSRNPIDYSKFDITFNLRITEEYIKG